LPLFVNMDVTAQDILKPVYFRRLAYVSGNNAAYPQKKSLGGFFQGKIFRLQHDDGTGFFAPGVAYKLYQDLPVPGKIPGADDDPRGIDFVEVVDSLEYVAVVDQIEAQGLYVPGYDIIRIVGAENQKQLHSVPKFNTV
jgi:hypothetical protein